MSFWSEVLRVPCALPVSYVPHRRVGSSEAFRESFALPVSYAFRESFERRRRVEEEERRRAEEERRRRVEEAFLLSSVLWELFAFRESFEELQRIKEEELQRIKVEERRRAEEEELQRIKEALRVSWGRLEEGKWPRNGAVNPKQTGQKGAAISGSKEFHDFSFEEKAPSFLSNYNAKKTEMDARGRNGNGLIALLTGSTSMSRNGQQSGRLSLHIGDKRLLDDNFRKSYGIQGDIKETFPLTSATMEEEQSSILVKLELTGPNKGVWEHSTDREGKLMLAEVQRLFTGRQLRQMANTGRCFPQSAHWWVETVEDCAPGQNLQAVVQIQRCAPDNANPPTWDENASILTVNLDITDNRIVAQTSAKPEGNRDFTDNRGNQDEAGEGLLDKYNTE